MMLHTVNLSNPEADDMSSMYGDMSGNSAFNPHAGHRNLDMIIGDLYVMNMSSCDIKFYPYKFSGPVMIHCHKLQHEDGGAMGFF
jgi:FtsP/CotA-like multicopper oxidase with cupredoxin domain